jgi:hypothetical protein
LGHTFTGLLKGHGVDIGLGGDAAYIETGSTHVATLEDHDLQALFGSIFSGAVASGPRADDDKIKAIHNQE